MVKILSRAGVSLADTYDVEGSIAGIEALESREVTLVHEMGRTIHSERMSGVIRIITTGVRLQNITFAVVLTDLPAGIFRILGVEMFADVAGRLTMAQVSLAADIPNGQEIPLAIWNIAADRETGIRVNLGGGATTVVSLQSTAPRPTLPTLGVGDGQLQRTDILSLRGITSGFGAGDVTVTALIHIAFARLGGVSSLGLPIPGW